MQAMKCDRCGKYYEYYSGGKKFKKFQSNSVLLLDIDTNRAYFARDGYDLCEDCMSALIDFLSGGATHDT